MKKLVFALFLLTISLNIQAQEVVDDKGTRAEQLMSETVGMKVDTDLFMAVTANTYVSESPKAVIMAMKIPDSYEASKKKMSNNQTDQFNVTDRGEKTINGVKVLFLEGTSDVEGITLNNTMYCIEINEDTCLMFIGMLEVGADAKYAKAITDAAHSIIK